MASGWLTRGWWVAVQKGDALASSTSALGLTPVVCPRTAVNLLTLRRNCE